MDRIAEPWGERTPFPAGAEWPVRVDTHLGGGLEPEQVRAWVRSASLLHSDGDAMDIAVADGRIVGVRGRPRTGSTGAAWGQRTCSAGRPTTRRIG